jgi:hypothetical protein
VDFGGSLLLVEHICIYLLISKTGFLCKQYGEGEERGERYAFEYTFYGAWATS